jgi:hypothetical protein
MSIWEENKCWSDQYLDEIKPILGAHLIGEAPEAEDRHRNTDLIVLRMDPVRIACRVRRPGYEKYGDEFTIRSCVSGGGKTELTKIIEGWGDYFFYGHGDNSGKLSSWNLCDLNVFRLWFNRFICSNGGLLPGISQANYDGSKFRAFKFSELPSDFVVASSKPQRINAIVSEVFF